jgi:hypothetical protein
VRIATLAMAVDTFHVYKPNLFFVFVILCFDKLAELEAISDMSRNLEVMDPLEFKNNSSENSDISSDTSSN